MQSFTPCQFGLFLKNFELFLSLFTFQKSSKLEIFLQINLEIMICDMMLKAEGNNVMFPFSRTNFFITNHFKILHDY